MFKSKLSLVAAAFTVLGAGSVFAFTPSISSIPDVIIGNRTPTDSFTPGDSFTFADTTESANGETPPDNFEFPDAINIFDLVEDQPAGVSGATADDSLVYFFAADNASVGGTDSTYSIQGTLIPPGGATVTPDVSGTLDFLDGPATAADSVIGQITYPFSNGAGDVTVGPADTINAAIMTLTVTNSQGNSASDEFFTYTVVNNPDSVSGGVPFISTPIDLSNWTYSGTAGSGALGADFAGDAGATGTKTADDDGDGSGNDLRLAITDHSSSTANPSADPWSPNESIQNWTSPIGVVPFVDGAAYRLRYKITEDAAAGVATGLVEARARWNYGTSGNLGNGNTVARPRVNRPSASGTWYYVMFDALDVASASNPATGNGAVEENDITLNFEAIDFFQNYGGAVELEEVIVDQGDAAAVAANQSVFFGVADFTSDTTDGSFSLGTGTNATATAAAGNTVLTTPALQGGTGFEVWGSSGSGLVVRLANAERLVNTQAVAQASGLVYRTEFTVDSTGNTPAAPSLAPLVLRVRTTGGGVPRDTSEMRVQSIREDGTINPAYSGVETYGAYHHFPSGFAADGVDPDGAGDGLDYGDGVSASVALEDLFDTEGGSVTVTGITINTVPENLLP